MGKISYLRRTSQIVFFFLIVYIGIIGIESLNLMLRTSQAEKEGNTLVASPSGYYELTDTYGPVKTCRYIAGDARLFKGCELNFISKTLTTYASINMAFLIPHILFFLALAFVFGRLFCGWMCPVGFIEEVAGYFRKRLGFRHIKFSESVKSKITKIRYAMLSSIIIISLAIAMPFLGIMAFQKELYIPGCQICPARIIIPFLGGERPIIYSFDTPIVIAFSTIGVFMFGIYLSSIVFRRPWCRICPSGAILSFFNTGSLLSKEKDVRKCTKCGICSRHCPMDNKNIYLEKKNKRVCTANCIRCFRCVENCPENGCLKIKLFGKTIYESGFKIGDKK
ncbi:MAG: 4Fe-4S binding protein [Candidatus Aenigmatarchaeota archaeon]